MKGSHIKKILLEKGISQGEVARRIGESQQNFSAALKSDDVKTGLLESIAAAETDATAPLDWITNARDSAFTRTPKDCIAVECRYTRNGASADESVFYFSPDGKRVVYSNSEHIDRTVEVFDALDEVGRIYEKLMR